MSFICQRNSYLQEFETSVLSCELDTLTLQNKQNVKGYNVIFEDTVLFPEGGGQNDDRDEDYDDDEHDDDHRPPPPPASLKAKQKHLM